MKMKITIFKSGFQLMLFGYPILGQTSGYQHIILFFKKRRIYILKIQHISCKDGYVFNFFPPFASYQ
jgi:hypothetical protein